MQARLCMHLEAIYISGMKLAREHHGRCAHRSSCLVRITRPRWSVAPQGGARCSLACGPVRLLRAPAALPVDAVLRAFGVFNSLQPFCSQRSSSCGLHVVANKKTSKQSMCSKEAHATNHIFEFTKNEPEPHTSEECPKQTCS